MCRNYLRRPRAGSLPIHGSGGFNLLLVYFQNGHFCKKRGRKENGKLGTCRNNEGVLELLFFGTAAIYLFTYLSIRTISVYMLLQAPSNFEIYDRNLKQNRIRMYYILDLGDRAHPWFIQMRERPWISSPNEYTFMLLYMHGKIICQKIL